MRTVVAVVLMLVLAGCVGKDASTLPEDRQSSDLAPAVIVDPLDPTTPTAGDALDAPVWKLGDAWAFTPIGDDGGEPGFLVVTAAEADSYRLESTSEGLAGFDAMFDVSFVGKIRARDLAGFQGSDAIQYFDFPLVDGKTWSTTWDGREITMTAKRTPRGFDIAGVSDGEPFVTYDFVPDLRWWSHLTFAEGYGIQVTRSLEGWSGQIPVATAKVIFESGPAAPILSGGGSPFTVDEGQSTVTLTVFGGGLAWLRTFMLTDPSGQPYLSNTTNAQLSEGVGEPSWYSYQEPLANLPGQWHVVSPVVHSPDAAGFVVIHQVAFAVKSFP